MPIQALPKVGAYLTDESQLVMLLFLDVDKAEAYVEATIPDEDGEYPVMEIDLKTLPDWRVVKDGNGTV